MADDPLYAPLGLEPPSRGERRISSGTLAAAVILIGAGVAWLVLARTPSRSGDSTVVSSIVVAPQPDARPSSASPSSSLPSFAPPSPVPSRADGPAPPSAASTAGLPPGSTVEMQNGVRIVRLNPAATSASVSMPVEPTAPAPLAPAPDARVSEPSPDGALPRIGRDGSRPSGVYARPAPRLDGPAVALLALGAGHDQLGSAEAARRLPAAIDFAVAPDAPDAGTQVAEMRRAGREMVLDAGASAMGDAKAARKLLAAWPGYVAVRLPAGAEAVEREARDRGVLPVGPAGEGDGVLMLDAADPAALDAAMVRLAGMARAKGRALGLVENAIPGRDALAQAATALAAQGVTLVPLSALAPQAAAAAR